MQNLSKGEYLDSRGNVRRYSAKYYARKKQIHRRVTIFVSLMVLLVGGGIFLLVRQLADSGSDTAPEAEPQIAVSQNEAEEEDVLLVEEDHEVQAVVLPAVDVAADPAEPKHEEAPEEGEKKETESIFYPGYEVIMDEKTDAINSKDMMSAYAVLVDMKDGHVVAAKNAGEKIYPASMTKVLTLLVAVEHIRDLDDSCTITQDITDYVYKHDCASVGYSVGETVSVRELLYGTILPSGGDAVLALTEYCAGSTEAFVDLMNEKVKELGLSSVAHFANPIGLHDEQNYCTPIAMAMIMKAALENDLCREVLATKRYTTASTEQHPDGIQISNLFLRRIEDKDTHGEVLGAKTGFVTQSRNCAVSYEQSNDGNRYICVTVGAHSAWRAIYDHVAIYDTYVE